jgi:long-chain acyl-CoA synthetase
MNETITGLFSGTAAEHSGNIAFNVFHHDEWQEISYRSVYERALATASYLAQNSAADGSRIALISENRPEWGIAYLGILMAGGIAVPLDAQLGPEEVSTLLLDSGAELVFCSSKTEGQLSLFIKEYSVIYGKAPMALNFDDSGFAAIYQTTSVSLPVKTPNDLASIIYTSGTTGNPKGVMLTHDNFCSDAKALIDAGIVSSSDNVLAILPLHHTYSFMCTLLVPVMVGAAITYPRSMKGPDMVSAIHDKGVTVVVGVPQLLALVRNNIVSRLGAQPLPVAYLLKGLMALSGLLRRRFDINTGKLIFGSLQRKFGSRFRFFTSGGAKLDPSVMLDLEALGFTVLEGYGLTETSPVVTFNPLRKRKPGSAGMPLPSVSLRISNPSESGEGEIEVSGPMVMQGYFKKPEATRDVMNEGWFRTGDLGTLDNDGYLFITGRSKEVIVLASGKNIYPEEIEKLYMRSRYIKEICVTGIEKSGSVSLHAVIVPDLEYAKQSGISNINETLKWEINAVSAGIPSYMRLTGFSLQKQPLPRTPLGKLRRFMVKASLAGQVKEPARKSAAEESRDGSEISIMALKAVREVARTEHAINGDDNLELDLGLDSLLKIELVTALERAFAIKLDEDFLADIFTIKELLEKLQSIVPSAKEERRTALAGWKAIIASDPAEKIVLEPASSMMLPSRIVHTMLRFLMRLMFRLETGDAVNIPRSGSYILAANHASYLDGFVLVLSLPFSLFRNLYSLGISDFFTGTFKGWFARTAHVVPIDSASFLNHALQTSAYLLRNGRAVCIYPEGGRSPDGSLLEFKKGVGIIAVEMGVPVVPVYIRGAFEALPRTAVFPKFSKISVTFGKPLSAADVDFSKRPPNMDEYQYFAFLIRERVRELSGAS